MTFDPQRHVSVKLKSSIDPIEMTQPPVPATLTRRRLLAGAELMDILAPRSAGAVVLKLDITLRAIVAADADRAARLRLRSDIGRNVTAVISGNLRTQRSCSRRLIPRAFIEKITSSDNDAALCTDWRTINARKAIGYNRICASGRWKIEGKGISPLGSCSPASNSSRQRVRPRRCGPALAADCPHWHRRDLSVSPATKVISIAASYSSTRLVKDRRVKRLAIMDQDGANVRYLTRGDDLVLTPRFNPSTQEITHDVRTGDPARLSPQHQADSQHEIVGNSPA